MHKEEKTLGRGKIKGKAGNTKTIRNCVKLHMHKK
jgi:hypothetical protein